MNSKYSVLIAGTLIATAYAPSAIAVCQDNSQSNSQADIIANSWNPCGTTRTESITDMQADYDMTDDDWSARGKALESECGLTTLQSDGGSFNNFDFELAKQLNAFTLLANGVDFVRNDSQLAINQSFHASVLVPTSPGDYLPLTSGGCCFNWHNWYRDQVLDKASFTARWLPRNDTFDEPDLVQTTCPMYDDLPGIPPFDGRLGLSNPAIRGAILAHEAWHAWENTHGQHIGTSCGHARCSGPANSTEKNGVVGVACTGANECDQWYPHEMETPAGGMVGQMHRPYQAMVEFECDVTDTPSAFVPTILIELAAADADFFANNDFINGPMPGCWRPNFGQFYTACKAQNGVQCDEANPCPNGQICSQQSGCCVQPSINFCASGACGPGGESIDGAAPGPCPSGDECDLTTGCCVLAPKPPQ